jgi:hypothetical protein
MKLLSVDPSNYNDAPTEGIRRILEEETGKDFPKGAPVDTSQIISIRMGTTVWRAVYRPLVAMWKHISRWQCTMSAPILDAETARQILT